MFALAPVTATAGEAKVQCYGGNSCKGMSSCKTANSACKGLNSCKGQGFVMTSQAKCDELGGVTSEDAWMKKLGKS